MSFTCFVTFLHPSLSSLLANVHPAVLYSPSSPSPPPSSPSSILLQKKSEINSDLGMFCSVRTCTARTASRSRCLPGLTDPSARTPPGPTRSPRQTCGTWSEGRAEAGGRGWRGCTRGSGRGSRTRTRRRPRLRKASFSISSNVSFRKLISVGRVYLYFSLSVPT